jgi:hypothetical protein
MRARDGIDGRPDLGAERALRLGGIRICVGPEEELMRIIEEDEERFPGPCYPGWPPQEPSE